MTKELRRVGVLMLVMFLALFGSATYIQALDADTLAQDPRNIRAIYASYSAERGPILVEGLPIAESVPVEGELPFIRQYPYGPIYAPVTGYFSLNQGTAGVEGAMNDVLSGQANSQWFEQLESLITGQPPQGAAVALTLSGAGQVAAVDALQGRNGAIIALDAETGEILVMASSPSYDPNALASHDTASVIAAYQALEDAPGGPLHNHTIGGDLYTPGSVFKLVVLAAALESGDYTLDSMMPNPASLQLPQSSSIVTNASGLACGDGAAQVSLAVALIQSCNIPFAELAQQLGQEAIAEQAEAFGFGDELFVPQSVTPSQYPTGMDLPETMMTGFGQFDVRVSPLQMAMISAAIANGGEMMQPTLIDQVIAPDLSILDDPAPQSLGQALDGDVAQLMHDVMIQSVTSGLATGAAIDGVTVGGKTGTAERGTDEPYNLWYTGFAQDGDRTIAIAVVVQPEENVQGEDSNSVSATIAQAVIEAVLNQ